MTPWLGRSLVLVATCSALALALGCKSPGAERAQAEPRAKPVPAAPAVVEPTRPAFEPGDAERGKQLVAQFECNRCHAGTGMAAPKLALDCVGCHEQIAADRFVASPAKLAKWKPHVMRYRDVPSLTALGGRVRPSFILEYLLHPHDLRPNLAQTMPRLKLTEAQARDVATYLTAGASASPAPIAVSDNPVQVARGRELMNEKGCLACHHMTGSGLSTPPSVEPAPRTLGLAPDLRFARDRAEPSALARWLLDPTKLKHDSAMPNLALRPEEARDLAAFLSFGSLEPTATAEPRARLPVLSRRVGFDEVNERVFAVTCRHCHTNPDLADGDGGPGNTGGFGFAARKIDFSSYQGIQSGGIDSQGQRVSLFAKTSEGLPLLVAALLSRAREEQGHHSDEVRGMPLGLPPLTPEQIQLVESWVDQGRPL